MDRMDVELASCAHRRAKVVRFAPRTWGHGGMSGASKGAWLHGMFELWFEEALHPAGRRCKFGASVLLREAVFEKRAFKLDF